MSNYFVEMDNITKYFPGVKALADVKFNLKSGEVLACLGENGAGKSTLMKILTGIYSKDSGTIKVYGEVVEDMTANRARELGIAIIHQELNMCHHLTVAENIFLGRELVNGIKLDNKTMNQEARKTLDSLGIELDPTTLIGDLSVSKQQMVEIAKAISLDAKILIMDEPTSALSAAEIRELFRIIKQFRDDGVGIVYISHRMEEIDRIADRVIILRDGHYITDMLYQDTNLDEIISHMVGREIKEKFPQVECKIGEKIFEVKNLNAGRLVRDINFELFAGEIVGIAGLMGAGRTETVRAIFGVDPKATGEIYIDSKQVTIDKPIDAIKAGLVLAPEDRRHQGLATKLSVRENVALPNLDILGGIFGTINRSKEKKMNAEAVENLKIRLPNVEVPAASLSGGNQQKVVVGKWLARDSRVVIFDEPTRGIDVAAKVEIYNLMNQLKEQGVAVLFVSSELPEVLGISDRILVMCDGKITADIKNEQVTQEQILHYATQFEDKKD
ncbi:MAG: sugar ABC transporter ATP-binding protein [Bacillota bacterium]|nr:sugar ABC transporter ATP-binding protein [Bacillota bacterium]